MLLATDLFVWLLLALPSVAVAVLVATLRYDLAFVFDWPLLIAGTLLVAVTSTAVGYAPAVVLPPMLAQLLTQVLVFFVLLFSPVTYPVGQLPGWVATLHDVLPVRPAADLLRAGLAADGCQAVATDLAVLGAWPGSPSVSMRWAAERDPLRSSGRRWPRSGRDVTLGHRVPDLPAAMLRRAS